MIETLKKSLLTGIGLALRSKNEIEDLAKDFAKQSEMNQNEAKAFLKECQDKYDDAKSSLDQRIETAIENVLEKLDLPSKSDLTAINDRIDNLEKLIAKNK